MNNITPYPVLEYVVNVIKKAISDIKVEYLTEGAVNLKDGNDTIHLEQKFDSTGNFATILINDPRDIIISEDLLPVLEHLQDGAPEKLKTGLQTTTVIINDLNVETQIIFQGVKDAFDQISNSYEWVKTIEKETTKTKSTFKFGAHKFDLTIMNESDQIFVQPEFAASFDPTIRKTIEEDSLKVQNAIYATFKG